MENLTRVWDGDASWEGREGEVFSNVVMPQLKPGQQHNPQPTSFARAIHQLFNTGRSPKSTKGIELAGQTFTMVEHRQCTMMKNDER
eukprot:4672725-Amphidinium_carterae.1